MKTILAASILSVALMGGVALAAPIAVSSPTSGVVSDVQDARMSRQEMMMNRKMMMRKKMMKRRMMMRNSRMNGMSHRM